MVRRNCNRFVLRICPMQSMLEKLGLALL